MLFINNLRFLIYVRFSKSETATSWQQCSPCILILHDYVTHRILSRGHPNDFLRVHTEAGYFRFGYNQNALHYCFDISNLEM